MIKVKEFQSTRPGWAATERQRIRIKFHRVSIHAARVGRDTEQTVCTLLKLVSIHAARVGRDNLAADRVFITVRFNPRGPGGPRLKGA